MDRPATALGTASLAVSIVVAWRQQRLAGRQQALGRAQSGQPV
jgi:hypothetical protein